MALGTRPRLDSLVLSLGQTWVANFFPPAGQQFPAGTTITCAIADNAGHVVTTWVATVNPTVAQFLVPSSQTDPIPTGSYFMVQANYPAQTAPVAIPAITRNLSRGSVVRDDNPTPLATPQITNVALTYADTPNLAAGVNPNWVRVGGTGNLKVWDNSAQSLAPGLAGDFVVFNTTAARWVAQNATDSVKIDVQVILGAVNSGKTTTVLCSNQSMTSWVGMRMQTGIANNTLDIVLGSGPTTYTVEATVSNTLANNDRYTFVYDPIADKYLIYKTSNFSAPVLTWQDMSHSIPHGNGYRYPGLLFEASLLSTGVQVTGWAIEDN